MKGSLWARLLQANLILLPVFLGLTGFYLERSYRVSLESAAQERLQVHALMLMAEAEYGEVIYMPEELLEGRFNHTSSGLYGLVSSPAGKVLWSSVSAVDLELQPYLKGTNNLGVGEKYFSRTDQFSHVAWSVLWQTDSGAEVPLLFQVVESTAPADAQLESFRTSLLVWLGGAALALIATQLFVVYWGLRPLGVLASDIAAVEAGDKEALEGIYVQEIQSLTDNMNSLLESEKRRRQRTRDTLSDLAHSLKTPLSIIRGADNSDPEFAYLVSQQTDLMEAIVSYQLQRASGGTHQLLRLVSVRHVVDRLRESLSKVYADKYMQFQIDVDADTMFRGDERDLLELLGNLIDNACKHGRSVVKVSSAFHGQRLRIAVEDDGEGIAPKLRDVIRNRGVRADTASPGHGIGLAIASDIAASYNGELIISGSELGGAKITAEFPAPK